MMVIDDLSRKQLLWIISTLRRECCDLGHWGKCDDEVKEYREQIIKPLLEQYNNKYGNDYGLMEMET